ncbi:MAG: sensor histidine kinase [Solirubrobacteraceae bacterium]
MRRHSLLVQILAVNALLIAGTVLVATIAVDLRLRPGQSGREFVVLGLAILASLLANALLLRRRLHPLEQLTATMEKVDLAAPGVRAEVGRGASRDVARLNASFNRMLERLESERQQAARAVLRAQEQERRRIAQDLHDEVNQALTAILLRLEASEQSAPPDLRAELAETRRIAQQAMEELLRLARELRPTALDDHGLLPALRSQVRDFAERTGIGADFKRRGAVPHLSSEQQLVIYRVTQESLSNVAQHSRAGRVDVELSFVGRTVLQVRDDGIGLPARRNGGLGLSGMRERALLAGGRLSIHSERGSGTTVTLTMDPSQ